MRLSSRIFIVLFSLILSHAVLTGCQERQPKMQTPPQFAPLVTPDQIRQMENAAQANPKDPEGWIALGNALYDSNQCSRRTGPQQGPGCLQAASAYQKALDIDPKNVNARVDMGTALWAGGQLEKALAEHRKAMKLDPNQPHAHMNAGITLMDLGRPKEAVKELEAYLKLSPDAPNAADVRKMVEELKAGTGGK